jgi:hypothetical protein
MKSFIRSRVFEYGLIAAGTILMAIISVGPRAQSPNLLQHRNLMAGGSELPQRF